jgi:phosphoribosylformylglycinamidine synthase I
MKSAVLVFPGSNCDRDMKVALREITGQDPVMAWHGDHDLPDVDLIAIPGGFSYGDYLRCGAMAANSPIMKEVVKRANDGVAVLGVCNGFQVLTECGLLPGTLMRNASLKFVCRNVHLSVEDANTTFTNKLSKDHPFSVSVAHGDGNFFAEPETLAEIENEGQVAFRYCDASGELSKTANPNGSLNSIAGIYNSRRNVLGMMPHPERHVDAATGGTDGKAIFESLMGALS